MRIEQLEHGRRDQHRGNRRIRELRVAVTAAHRALVVRRIADGPAGRAGAVIGDDPDRGMTPPQGYCRDDPGNGPHGISSVMPWGILVNDYFASSAIDHTKSVCIPESFCDPRVTGRYSV